MSQDPLFFLNHQSYGTYNRQFARKYGIAAAVMLAELIEKRSYHLHELISDQKHGKGWFYHTLECVEERTGLSKHEQPTALKKLMAAGFLEVKTFGLPCKRHFRLNDEVILAFFGFAIIKPKVPDPQDSDKEEVSAEEHYPRKLDSGFRETGFPESGKLYDRKAETHIYKEPKEEPKGRYIAPQSDAKKKSDVSSLEPKIERAPHVETTEKEHKKLIADFGEGMTAQGYDELSEWKQSAQPSQVKRHNSDYFRLRKWVIPQLIEKQPSGAAIAKHRQGSKLVTAGDSEQSSFKRREI